MTIEFRKLVRKSDDQISCDLNGEVAILNLKSTLYFGLNEVGATIWAALDEAKSADDLCKLILNRFDVDAKRCEADISDLLAKLEKAGLIEVVERRVSDPAVVEQSK